MTTGSDGTFSVQDFDTPSIPQTGDIEKCFVIFTTKSDGKVKARCVHDGRCQKRLLTSYFASPTMLEDTLSICLAVTASEGCDAQSMGQLVQYHFRHFLQVLSYFRRSLMDMMIMNADIRLLFYIQQTSKYTRTCFIHLLLNLLAFCDAE